MSQERNKSTLKNQDDIYDDPEKTERDRLNHSSLYQESEKKIEEQKKKFEDSSRKISEKNNLS